MPADLPTSILDQLRTFQEVVDEMRDSRVLAEPQQFTVRRGLGSTPDPENAFEGIDREPLRSFLISLRRFWLKGEPTNIHKVAKVVIDKCPDERLQEWARFAVARWDARMHHHPLSYRIGEKAITVEEAMRLILNGLIFHGDQEKRSYLKSLSPGAVATIRWIVERSLADLFEAAATLDGVIYYWLDTVPDEYPPAPVWPEAPSDGDPT